MKKQFYFIFFSALLLCGCAFKGDTITFGDIKAQIQNLQNIKLAEFIDSRREKPLIAVIKNSNHETVKNIFISNDLGAWLSDALRKELSVVSIATKSEIPIIIGAEIKELYVEYTKNPLATKNLLLQAHIVMKMDRGGESLTKEYFVKEQKYISFLSSSDELSPHIQDMITQIVASMAIDISKWGIIR